MPGYARLFAMTWGILALTAALSLASCGDDVAIVGVEGEDAAATDQDAVVSGDAATDALTAQDVAIQPDGADADAADADAAGPEVVDTAIGTDATTDGGLDADGTTIDAAQDATADTAPAPDAVVDCADAGCGAPDVPLGTDASPADDATVAQDTPDTPDTLDAGPVGCTTALDCAGDVTVCQAWACVEGQCAIVPAADGSACEDGNACTGPDVCNAGGCVGGGNVCDCLVDGDCNDGNVCTDDSCDGAKKCQHSANSQACDDSDACTEGDVCAASACQSGVKKTCDDANLCTDDLCSASDGSCANTPNSGACQDGNACTSGDLCAGGTCTPGALVICSDANPCTDDACEAAGGCVALANAATCDDGDLCTLSDVCANSKCAGAVNACDDKNLCTVDLCDAKTGACFHANIAVDCDDGDACTSGDSCKSGVCAPGTAKSCNDGNVCTLDACDPATGTCMTATANGACEDGDLCTLGDTCGGGTCTPGTKKVCNDGNVCTDDGCDPLTGCTVSNNTASCAPGNSCEIGSCSSGSCQATGQIGCNDNNPCTTDTCVPGTGCVFTPVADATACGSATACEAAATCQTGVCQKGAATDCSDGKPCTKDGCDPANGCLWTANTDPCDDGNACTVGDVCKNGGCKSGAAIDPKTCDDSNLCTDDSCDPAKGCVHANNAAACDDASNCTTGDVCGGGACTGTPVNCNDSNPCTVDQCNAADGTCFWTANNAVCDDGNACTVGDACKLTQCLGGAQKSCDDGVVCTTDTCDIKTGVCTYSNNTAACEDGSPCTQNDACSGGSCVSGSAKSCDDGNACTTDSCDSATGGCIFNANTAPCDSGDKCTFGDKCSNGACVKGSGVVCNDNNVCTGDACDAATGQCSFTAVANGSTCDDTLACTTNSCQAGKCAVTASTCSLFSDAFSCAAVGTGWTLDKPAGKAVLWNVDQTPVIGSASEQAAHACSLNYNDGTDYCDPVGLGGCSNTIGNATSPVIDATAAFGVVTLKFDTWVDVDTTAADGAETPTVTLVDATSGATLAAFTLNTSAANSNVWRALAVGVNGVSGHKFKMIFNLPGATVAGYSYGDLRKGWFIDNINVAEVTAPEVCNDGLDNDGNGATDCADAACVADPACNVEICNDGIDNDRDDAIDCADSDCKTSTYCLQAVKTWSLDCGDASWAFTAALGNNVAWAIDATPITPPPVSGSCTLNFNNGTNYCINATCTNAGGPAPNGSATLVTAFDATAYKSGLTLQYWHYMDVEDPAGNGGQSANFDIGYVDVSTSNFICANGAAACPSGGNPYAAGTTTFIVAKTPLKTWLQSALDLTAFAGKSFKIRYRFDALDNQNNNHPGIFIDDVSLFGW